MRTHFCSSTFHRQLGEVWRESDETRACHFSFCAADFANFNCEKTPCKEFPRCLSGNVNLRLLLLIVNQATNQNCETCCKLAVKHPIKLEFGKGNMLKCNIQLSTFHGVMRPQLQNCFLSLSCQVFYFRTNLATEAFPHIALMTHLFLVGQVNKTQKIQLCNMLCNLTPIPKTQPCNGLFAGVHAVCDSSGWSLAGRAGAHVLLSQRICTVKKGQINILLQACVYDEQQK